MIQLKARKILKLFTVFVAVYCASIFLFSALYNTQLTDDNIRERIGQILLIGFRGCDISEDSNISAAMNDLNIGGVILFDIDGPSGSFPRNIKSPSQIKNLTRQLRRFSPSPLFIAIDAEGGPVNRLKSKYGFITVPGAFELGSSNDISKTKNISGLLARQLKDLGINMNLAPVVDLNINPKNPVINKAKRSFSGDPEKVTAHAEAFIDSHTENGVITVLKHFPGHGSSNTDSHKGIADITETYNRKELTPFKRIIARGKANAIMTAHVINRNIDKEHPATLSSKFIRGILRDQLDFKGVVISDDIQMASISDSYSLEESIVRALNAGCDIILISNNTGSYDKNLPYKAYSAILQAVYSGKIPRERIAESYRRIKYLKKKFGIIK